MADIYVTRVRTESGDKQIDYNALANLPTSDKTLKISGEFADSKETGDAIAKVSSDVQQLRNDTDTYVSGLSSDIQTLRSDTSAHVSELSSDIQTLRSDTDASIEALGKGIDEKIASVYVKNDSGETVMQTPITMNGNKITGLGDPVNNTDAVTKLYVDSKYFSVSAKIGTSWTGSKEPYTQSITISGIKSTDCPHIAPVYSSTLNTALKQRESWLMVNKAETADGKITFTCFEDKPEVEIPIQVEVHR